jgi:hypothetical protein
MIDFSICKNCLLPIFFDWKGAHHVRPEKYGSLGLLQFSSESKPCDNPQAISEEE